MSASALSDSAAERLATVLYHEGRHAEQNYLAERHAMQEKRTAGLVERVLDWMTERRKVPEEVSEAAANVPLPPGSPQADCAREMKTGLYDDTAKHQATQGNALQKRGALEEAKAKLNRIRTDPASTSKQVLEADQEVQAAQAAYDQALAVYRRIPYEAEAFAIGAKIKILW